MNKSNCFLAAAIVPAALLLGACHTASPSSDSGSYSLTKRLPYSFGKEKTADGGSICEVAASAPAHSLLKKQQLMLYVDRISLAGTSSSGFFMATGATKSLNDVQTELANGLKRAATAAPGTELFKVGNVKYGGELRVVALGHGRVRFAYNPVPAGSSNPDLNAEEVATFAKILSR